MFKRALRKLEDAGIKKKYLLWGIVILVAVLAGGYFFFFKVTECPDKQCFDDKLRNCEKAVYLSESEQATWHYKILGAEGVNCMTEVTLVQLKQGKVNLQVLEGKSMVCSTLKGEVVLPESNINNCHGLLKEEMQKVLIEKMHAYLLQNIGQVSEGLEQAI